MTFAEKEFSFEIWGTPSLEQIMNCDEGYNLKVRNARRQDQENIGKNLDPVIETELWQPVLNGSSLDQETRILDVGSGLAYHLSTMPSSFYSRTYMLDIAEQTLRHAKKLYPGVHILRRDWWDTHLPDSSFTIITGFKWYFLVSVSYYVFCNLF